MDPAILSGGLVPQGVLMLHLRIGPVSSQTEIQPLQPRNLLCSPGPELDMQPEELLQKNVDHFSLLQPLKTSCS